MRVQCPIAIVATIASSAMSSLHSLGALHGLSTDLASMCSRAFRSVAFFTPGLAEAFSGFSLQPFAQKKSPNSGRIVRIAVRQSSIALYLVTMRKTTVE